MKDLVLLRDLILEVVDLTDVMVGYGVEFVYNPHAASEVQFKCPFHGKDNKPSARLYKETKSLWCWKCHKRWNVIDFIKDKESLSYIGAVLHIIDRYRVDTSSIPDTPRSLIENNTPIEISEDNIEFLRIRGKIMELRGKAVFEKFNAVCSAWNMISFAYAQGKPVTESLKKLDMKVDSLCQQL